MACAQASTSARGLAQVLRHFLAQNLVWRSYKGAFDIFVTRTLESTSSSIVVNFQQPGVYFYGATPSFQYMYVSCGRVERARRRVGSARACVL